MLLVSVLTCGIAYVPVHIIGIVEGILYLTKSDGEFYREYAVQKKGWFELIVNLWGGVERSEAHHARWPVGWWASLRSTPPYMLLRVSEFPERRDDVHPDGPHGGEDPAEDAHRQSQWRRRRPGPGVRSGS